MATRAADGRQARRVRRAMRRRPAGWAAIACVCAVALLGVVPGLAPGAAALPGGGPDTATRYIGEWLATGTSETCTMVNGSPMCQSNAAGAKTLHLRGVCDGAGGCEVHLATGWDWTPVPNPICASTYGAAGFEIKPSFPYTDLKATFTTAPGDGSTLQLDLDVTSPIASNPLTVRHDVLTAARSSIPAGSDDSMCKPPLAPTGVTAAPGDGQALVSWTAPADNGAQPVVGSTVHASPGNASCLAFGGDTSCTVPGLTNGVTYTFTVVAHNASGDSPPSAASAPAHLTTCGAGRSGPFTDVGGSHPFCADIEWLSVSGVTTGFADGSFRPNDKVTRMAMAAFLYRQAGNPAFTPPAVASFKDVPTGAPFFKEIEWLKTTGVTTGYADGTFRPSLAIQRQAMAAFLYRRIGSPAFTPPSVPTFKDVPVGAPFFKEIEWFKSAGITTGYADGTFKPSNDVERQAMAAFLHRFSHL